MCGSMGNESVHLTYALGSCITRSFFPKATTCSLTAGVHVVPWDCSRRGLATPGFLLVHFCGWPTCDVLIFFLLRG